MARAPFISDRLTGRLARPHVRVATPDPIAWRALPVPPGGRHGWLRPMRLTPDEDALVAFCPELIDAATDDLATVELERFLDTLGLLLDAHLAFPGLDPSVVTRRVDAHLASTAPADHARHLRVTARAVDLAAARPRPPGRRTPAHERVDARLHLEAILGDAVDVALVPLDADPRRCPGGFRRMDLRRREFPVDPDRLTAWSAPLDDRQHDRWLDVAAGAAYVAGRCHRYVTTPGRIVDELFARDADAALFAALLGHGRGLSLAELLGEHH
jgi:hypothetical protein